MNAGGRTRATIDRKPLLPAQAAEHAKLHAASRGPHSPLCGRRFPGRSSVAAFVVSRLKRLPIKPRKSRSPTLPLRPIPEIPEMRPPPLSRRRKLCKPSRNSPRLRFSSETDSRNSRNAPTPTRSAAAKTVQSFPKLRRARAFPLRPFPVIPEMHPLPPAQPRRKPCNPSRNSAAPRVSPLRPIPVIPEMHPLPPLSRWRKPCNPSRNSAAPRVSPLRPIPVIPEIHPLPPLSRRRKPCNPSRKSAAPAFFL